MYILIEVNITLQKEFINHWSISKFTLLIEFIYLLYMGYFTPWGEYNCLQNGIKLLL